MTQYLLPKHKWPKVLQHKAVRAIAVDGCVDGGMKEMGTALAHAHCSYNDLHQGYICFRSKKMITRATCLHELAHLLAPRERDHHGPKWKQTLWKMSERSWLDRERIIAHIYFGYLPFDIATFIYYIMPFIITGMIGISWRHLFPTPHPHSILYDVVSFILSAIFGLLIMYCSVRGAVLAHMRKISKE